MSRSADADRIRVDALAASIPALAARVVDRHHAAVKARLLEVDGLIRQATVFPATGEARRFAARYERLRRDLLAHLEREEREDFPAFLAAARAWRDGDAAAPAPAPAPRHADEHESAARDLREVFALALRLPDGNKPLVMAALRRALAAMADDFLHHGRDEDEILQPAVAAVRAALAARRAVAVAGQA